MNVEFPGLGLSFEISNVAFSVFGVPIYWYGIIIASAFLIAIVLALRSCRKYDIDPDTILDLVLYAAPAAIIGSRIYYVIFNWSYFKGDLKAIIDIRSGGLAIYGAVIAAVIVAWIYCRKKKVIFFKLTDFAVPYLVLGQAIGRWGNFINQEAFGYETTLPWRMNSDAVNADIISRVGDIDLTKWGAHPTFLYESLWNIAVFAFLLFYRRKKKVNGEVLSLYFILYGVGRFFIENLRTDSLMLGQFRASRLLSLVLAAAFTGILIYLRTKKSVEEKEEIEPEVRSEYSDLLEKMRMEEEELKEAAEEVHEEVQDDAQDSAENNPEDKSEKDDADSKNPDEGDEKQEEAAEQEKQVEQQEA